MGMRIITVWSIKKYWRNVTFRPTLTRSKTRDSPFRRMFLSNPLEVQSVRVKGIVSFLISTIDFITNQFMKGVIY